jgi:2,3,4,5-tetrahydropyridine-2,6-dicarboxylate N-succinyltransferase
MESIINAIWEKPELAELADNQKAIEDVLALLNNGKIRVAEPNGDSWVVHQWVKKAILLYFRIRKMEKMEAGFLEFYDKMALKKDFASLGVRSVPLAVARYGSYLAPGVILMPSYVNIGAYVDAGTMVDTWATVGSCAQIGKNVHLSGGVGIGGVLEPLQANPVIIEDGVFIGSRSIIVEGARIGKEAVIGAGVTITGSTRIVDVRTQPLKEYKGFVPPRSVVIPGTLPKEFPGGTFGVPCALLIGERKESTDLKTSLNQTLRDFGVSV